MPPPPQRARARRSRGPARARWIIKAPPSLALPALLASLAFLVGLLPVAYFAAVESGGGGGGGGGTAAAAGAPSSSSRAAKRSGDEAAPEAEDRGRGSASASVQIDGDGDGDGGETPKARSSARSTTGRTPRFRYHFPPFGTPEYRSRCGWSLPPSSSDPSRAPPPRRRRYNRCTLSVKQNPSGNEGIAHWISEVTAGFLYSLQTGCRLVVEYADGVDLSEVLRPPAAAAAAESESESSERGEDARRMMDWPAPRGFNCSEEERCVRVSDYWGKAATRIGRGRNMKLVADGLGLSSDERTSADGGGAGGTPELVAVPEYRYAMSDGPFADLAAALPPGFRPRDGAACAFHRLFELSPTFARYAPRLFTELLPAVRDPDAAVIALYLRTGRTDELAEAEADRRGWGDGRENVELKMKRRKDGTLVMAEGGGEMPEGMEILGLKGRRLLEEEESRRREEEEDDDATPLGRAEEGAIRCALQAERDLLASSPGKYRRVVWTAVSDSPNVARLVRQGWGDANATAAGPPGAGGAGSLPRRVLTTSSSGLHVRPRRGPTTSDFAQAFADWYLLGEADAMATGSMGPSFGRTAHLRTGAGGRMYATVGRGYACERRDWGEW